MQPVDPSPGNQLGPYRIISRIGAGGMGIVFKAWDTRLERDVAIKILHPEPGADDTHCHRLLAEGRAASALNHPNVLRVYDAAVEGSSIYLVSEWLEGNSLRSELQRGPLPVKRLLDLAVQIAEGLAAAHAMGIAHRDIKPENVMLARDGSARIVDFGLARHERSIISSDQQVTHTATVSLDGGLCGTPAYMSPEQARGQLGDFRTDQFSFGAMLQEMATGVRAFQRNTTAETLTAILHDEPRRIAELNPRVPAALGWIVEQCLEKDPAERYAATEDLARELRRLREHLREAFAEVRIGKPESRRGRTLAIAAAAAVLGATLVAVPGALAPATPELRFSPIASEAAYEGAPIWSPDGESLAFVADINGVLQVFVRRLTNAVPTQVTQGRFDAEEPFWSADGRALYFISPAGDALGLWTVGAAGGHPELVVNNVNHAAIDRAGRRLALLRTDTALNQRLWWAAPDGSQLAIEKRPPFDTADFGVGGELKFRPDGQSVLAWLFVAGTPTSATTSVFYLVPSDAAQPVTRVLSQIAVTANLPSFSWTPDGRHVVLGLTDAESGRRHLWTADTQSTWMRRLTSTHTNETWPAVSPDGRRIAYVSDEVDFDLVGITENGKVVRKTLATARNEMDPAWAPNGDQYAFVTDRTGPMEIWLRSRDGQWERPIVSGRDFGASAIDTLGSLAFAPDGKTLAYHRRSSDGALLWLTPSTGGTPAKLIPEGTTFNFQDTPSWSADGEWIAFIGAEGSDFTLAKVRIGTREIVRLVEHVRPFTRAAWSPDGKWILCETADGLIRVAAGGGTPQLISDEALLTYDWARDSRRIIALAEGEAAGHIVVLEIAIDTGAVKVLNADLATIPVANQPIRGFSLVADREILTSFSSARSDIWLLEGFAPPVHGLWRWPRGLTDWFPR